MHHHSHRGACCNPFVLVEKLFWAAAVTCFLYAAHRIATALKLRARIDVLDELDDELSDEERETLLAKVKARALNL